MGDTEAQKPDIELKAPKMNGSSEEDSKDDNSEVFENDEPEAQQHDKDENDPLNNDKTIDLFGNQDNQYSDEDDDYDEDGPDRASWGGKLEFLFTCIGYAVGLGNVWRFPYLAYKNGGGAFLLPYTFMLGLVGLPLFFMELSFGQFASLGPITIWKINPLLKGLGYAMVSVSWLIGVYYNVVISHVMLYLFASIRAIFTGLPWITCDNEWNSEFCISNVYNEEPNTNISQVNVSLVETVTGTIGYEFGKGNLSAAAKGVVRSVNGSIYAKTAAEEYYNNYVLEMSSGIDEAGGVNWKLALCLLLSWAIVLICLIRGIQSLGKVVYFTAIFPYLMLTILLIRGVSLPGAGTGIIFYLKPDFSKLLDARVWCDAATQIFYSLSACSGGLIAMSSYNKFNNNCLKDSLIVALVNCGTSIYSGFVIFSVLGFMAQEKGVPVADVAEGGPGLAFIVYPEAISRMPVPQMWAIFFFFMMATLGFGSQFSIMEAVLSAFSDEFAAHLRNKWRCIALRTCIIVFTFFLGLPMVTRGGIYLLNLVDYSVSGFPLLVVGCLECIALNWIYGSGRFEKDIEMMLGHKPNIYWKVCWKYLTPGIILVIVVFNCIYYKKPTLDEYHYPEWAVNLGWMIGMFPVFLIVIFFLYRFCKDGGWELLQYIQKPKGDWGPALPKDRTGAYETHDVHLSNIYIGPRPTITISPSKGGKNGKGSRQSSLKPVDIRVEQLRLVASRAISKHKSYEIGVDSIGETEPDGTIRGAKLQVAQSETHIAKPSRLAGLRKAFSNRLVGSPKKEAEDESKV